MTSLFDRLLVGALPLVPRAVVHRVARRYVAGETLEHALRTVVAMNAEGALATVDVLGEEITEAAQAKLEKEEYLELLEAIARRQLRAGVSVKLTALGLEVDQQLCERNLRQIAERARELDRFVRIDMEDHSCTDATLRIYRDMQRQLGNLGVVLQAMLHRTANDARELAAEQANVRLCKGIYREPAAIAYHDAEAIRGSFITALETLLRGGCYVAIATHDEALIRRSLSLLQRLGTPPTGYEFQMLLGVLPRLRRRLLGDGHRLRVYVPYGEQWYAYCVRRLRENPAMGRQVLRAMFARG